MLGGCCQPKVRSDLFSDRLYANQIYDCIFKRKAVFQICVSQAFCCRQLERLAFYGQLLPHRMGNQVGTTNTTLVSTTSYLQRTIVSGHHLGRIPLFLG
jgi:hypothetical protein